MTRVKDILTSNILRISVLFDIIIFYKTIASVHCKNTFDRQNQKCIFCDTIKLRNCVVQTALEYKQHELGAGFKLELIYHYQSRDYRVGPMPHSTGKQNNSNSGFFHCGII